ncbi:MAG: dimethylarginine dimethylaminohydrolase family protein [Gemmatimonadales bacterium]
MHFTRAIVRPPAPTFADGITSSNLGRPDLSLALQQHESYCRALERLGLTLDRLPPDSDFPDSTFVEDAAIVTERGAILTRPGASSRAGEVQAMSAALGRWFPQLDRITSPGTLDGGDVCEAGDHFFIGVSHRTNEEGATQLAGWLEQRGFGSSLIDIRGISGMLHHKTGISWLGERRLLAWRGIAGHEAFRGWQVVEVPQDEEYAANCIRVNDTVLVAKGFPKTAARLGDLGYDVLPIDMSEYRKMDGGLSCLSVRW